MADQAPKDLIGFLDYYLVTKAPFQLPIAAKEAIVKYWPWISVVLLVLALPPLLLVLGLGALLVPFAVPFGGPGYAVGFTYLTVLLIIQIGLLIAALPGLFARKMQGWRLIFYSRLLSILSTLLSGLIVNAVIGGLISLYILFQVRALYEEKTEPAKVQDQIRTT
jgi:hypothetical protein